jgi:penicillin-binding protein 1A
MAKSKKARGKKAKAPLWRRLLKWTLILGVTGAVIGMTGLAGIFHFYSRDLPPVLARKDFKPPQMTRVYANGGELIAKFARPGGGKRTVVPMDEIPEHVRFSFMAAEDADFMTHSGIDYLGMVRAFYYAIFYDTGLKGTSTITQQVVKNLILTPERSVRRKVREIVLARELEQTLPKEDILWLYLNELYLGHGVNGVEEAALLYFGKRAKDLELHESAVLAGITQSPERLSPIKHPERALKRRKFVLEQLWQKGFIEEDEYRKADAAELVLAKRSEVEPHLNTAPFFTEHVRQLLLERYGEDEVYTGGLRVHTTLDVAKQRGARAGVAEGMAAYDARRKFFGPVRTLKGAKIDDFIAKSTKKIKELKPGKTYEGVVTATEGDDALVQIGAVGARLIIEPKERVLARAGVDSIAEAIGRGDVVRVRLSTAPGLEEGEVAVEFEPGPEPGLVMIDPRTRDVVAMIGGYDWTYNKYNHATQAKRQTGSTFKPIVYAAALAGGTTKSGERVTPATIYDDGPVTLKMKGAPDYSPRNSDGTWRGPIRLREALGASRNVVAVKILVDLGIDKAIEFARTIGITGELDERYTMVMGSSSLTIIEMVNAYATFASGGELAEPRFITRIERASGELERFPSKPRQVIPPEVAYLITDVMLAVTGGYTSSTGQRRQGTGAVVRSLGHPVAGKTGTTNEARDAWFIGFTPHLVAGVWVGFSSGNRPLGRKEYGGRVAAPIWLSAMKAAHEGLEKKKFTPPATGIETVAIDPKDGKLACASRKSIVETFLVGTAPTEQSPCGQGVDAFILGQY